MTIGLVQQVAAKTTAGGSATKTITLPGGTTAGNALRLLIGRPPSLTISSVTGAGTWSLTGTVTEASSTNTVDVWQCDNISGGVTTVSVTISNTYAIAECNLSEWSGMPGTPVGDGGPSTNTGTSATLTTAGVMPTGGNQILLLAVGCVNAAVTVMNSPTGGFTALSRSATATLYGFGYQIVASASGSYSTTWPISVGYRPWAAVIAGWDGASGGGGSSIGADAMMLMSQKFVTAGGVF